MDRSAIGKVGFGPFIVHAWAGYNCQSIPQRLELMKAANREIVPLLNNVPHRAFKCEMPLVYVKLSVYELVCNLCIKLESKGSKGVVSRVIFHSRLWTLWSRSQEAGNLILAQRVAAPMSQPSSHPSSSSLKSTATQEPGLAHGCFKDKRKTMGYESALESICVNSYLSAALDVFRKYAVLGIIERDVPYLMFLIDILFYR